VRVLFIGGTGFISTTVSRLAVAKGIELFLLNRGHQTPQSGCQQITADFHNEAEVRKALQDEAFDVVVDWIAYTPADVARDLRLFQGRVKQFVFISSASAYQKPPSHY